MASSYVPSSGLGVLPSGFDFDSLPYIDGEVDPLRLSMARDLIVQEMRKFRPKDYLKDFPAPQLRFANSEGLQKEIERISRGGPAEKLDMSRYNVEPPADAMKNDAQAWRKAVDNAKSQVKTYIY